MEDEHGDGGGRREGLGDQHELLGRGEGGRQQRGQILHRDVGWQGWGQGQHGRHDAVCEQAFLFGTEKTQTHTHTFVFHMHSNLRRKTMTSSEWLVGEKR